MAVVFISPKKRQQLFFIGLTLIFVLILIFIGAFVFLSQPQPVASELVFNKPKVIINFTALDSDQFKELVPFIQMQSQFVYSGTNEAGKTVGGFVEAASIDEATANLKALKITVTQIEEVEVGRENPFVPYYQKTTTK